jgi:transcription elongation GreA/GreB family factor
MSLKRKIYEQCRKLAAARVLAHQQSLQELISSAAEETKSSAGDKFETGRAMLHIEQDHIRKQLAEALAQQAVLAAIDPGLSPGRAGLGSLVRMADSYYFLSTALGKMSVDGRAVIALSMQSPLGSRLAGLAVGDRVTMNGKELIVEELA